MKISYGVKALLLLTFFASLLSFAKFDHCYNKNWATPDVYTHACYSDISSLYGARDLINHTWPYSSATNAVEYPPLTGVVMWATSLISGHSYHQYFLINVFLIALLFCATALIVARIKPEYWYLYPLTPAVIASLYINWDMWAVVTMLASIYYFDKGRYRLSSILLGISVATKFFPLVLLAPIVMIFLKRHEIRRTLTYVASVLAVAVAINLPFAITTPHGWWRFFALNGSRGVDFGSAWYALQLLGVNIASANILSLLLLLAVLAIFTYFLWRLRAVPSLAQVAFIAVAIFVSASKVYSPQYLLWLAPLGVIALSDKRLRSAFWIWQGLELAYHLAIWEYLANYTGARFGLPATPYAIATLLRIAGVGYFAIRIGAGLWTQENGRNRTDLMEYSTSAQPLTDR